MLHLLTKIIYLYWRHSLLKQDNFFEKTCCRLYNGAVYFVGTEQMFCSNLFECAAIKNVVLERFVCATIECCTILVAKNSILQYSFYFLTNS